MEAVRAAACGTAAQIADAVRRDLDAFRGDEHRRDDVTLVVIKVLPVGGNARAGTVCGDGIGQGGGAGASGCSARSSQIHVRPPLEERDARSESDRGDEARGRGGSSTT